MVRKLSSDEVDAYFAEACEFIARTQVKFAPSRSLYWGRFWLGEASRDLEELGFGTCRMCMVCNMLRHAVDHALRLMALELLNE